MAALRSLVPFTPEDRVEVELDLARARGQAQDLRFRLSGLEARNAPKSYQGKLWYQLSVQQRWILKYEQWLGITEQAA